MTNGLIITTTQHWNILYVIVLPTPRKIENLFFLHIYFYVMSILFLVQGEIS